MKIQKPFQFRHEAKPVGVSGGSGYLQKKASFFPLINPESFFYRIKSLTLTTTASLSDFVLVFLQKSKSFGFTKVMDDYEKRKLSIFNQLNFFQFFTGIIVPLTVIFGDKKISLIAATAIITPPLISLLALYLNAVGRHSAAMLSYFILYPFFTSLAYINGMNLGTELFFVLYGILSVFFLQQISHIIFCIGFSMINYFMLAVVLKEYQYNMELSHPVIYLFNHLLAIGFIFYGLYLIKKENTGYQSGILNKNSELQLMNEKIQKQKEEIGEKVGQLEEQALRLNELDRVKNRLFSIVSHDLKAPMYALRNLFLEIQQYKMKASDINNLVPLVVKDLDYTTGLMENLLHWAKSQMHAGSVNPQSLDVKVLVNEITQQQRLQAEIKNIRVEVHIHDSLCVYVDRDMISLVIRNLLSNAIKFSQPNDIVIIDAREIPLGIEILVKDSGAGISSEALNKILENNFYSTKGTENETGTGLGLMLCKEFLEKNGGRMHIESKPGKGSVFSFTVPKAEKHK